MFRLLVCSFSFAALAACNVPDVGPTSRAPQEEVDLGGGLFLVSIDDEHYYLFLDGAITPETSFQFQSLTEHDDVRSLVIANSPGGNLQAAHQIGKTIQQEKISTALLGYCASACVDVFIAGQDREIDPQAVLAMHPATNRDFGYSIDAPYLGALGMGAINEAVYKMADNEVWEVSAARAIELKMATGYLTGEE